MQVQNRNICCRINTNAVGSVVLASLMAAAALAGLVLGLFQFIGPGAKRLGSDGALRPVTVPPGGTGYTTSIGTGYGLLIGVAVVNLLLVVLAIVNNARVRADEFPAVTKDPTVFVTKESGAMPGRPALRAPGRSVLSHPAGGGRDSLDSFDMSGSIAAGMTNVSFGSDGGSVWSGGRTSAHSGMSAGSSVRFDMKHEQTDL